MAQKKRVSHASNGRAEHYMAFVSPWTVGVRPERDSEMSPRFRLADEESTVCSSNEYTASHAQHRAALTITGSF